MPRGWPTLGIRSRHRHTTNGLLPSCALCTDYNVRIGKSVFYARRKIVRETFRGKTKIRGDDRRSEFNANVIIVIKYRVINVAKLYMRYATAENSRRNFAWKKSHVFNCSRLMTHEYSIYVSRTDRKGDKGRTYSFRVQIILIHNVVRTDGFLRRISLGIHHTHATRWTYIYTVSARTPIIIIKQ